MDTTPINVDDILNSPTALETQYLTTDDDDAFFAQIADHGTGRGRGNVVFTTALTTDSLDSLLSPPPQTFSDISQRNQRLLYELTPQQNAFTSPIDQRLQQYVYNTNASPDGAKMESNLLSLSTYPNIMKELEERKTLTGVPTCISINHKFIVIGTSLGFIWIFDHFQTRYSCFGTAKEYRPDTFLRGPVIALDITQDNEHIIAGHRNGCVVIWELHAKAILKVIEDFVLPSSISNPRMITPVLQIIALPWNNVATKQMEYETLKKSVLQQIMVSGPGGAGIGASRDARHSISSHRPPAQNLGQDTPLDEQKKHVNFLFVNTNGGLALVHLHKRILTWSYDVKWVMNNAEKPILHASLIPATQAAGFFKMSNNSVLSNLNAFYNGTISQSELMQALSSGSSNTGELVSSLSSIPSSFSSLGESFGSSSFSKSSNLSALLPHIHTIVEDYNLIAVSFEERMMIVAIEPTVKVLGVISRDFQPPQNFADHGLTMHPVIRPFAPVFSSWRPSRALTSEATATSSSTPTPEIQQSSSVASSPVADAGSTFTQIYNKNIFSYYTGTLPFTAYTNFPILAASRGTLLQLFIAFDPQSLSLDTQEQYYKAKKIPIPSPSQGPQASNAPSTVSQIPISMEKIYIISFPCEIYATSWLNDNTLLIFTLNNPGIPAAHTEPNPRGAMTAYALDATTLQIFEHFSVPSSIQQPLQPHRTSSQAQSIQYDWRGYATTIARTYGHTNAMCVVLGTECTVQNIKIINFFDRINLIAEKDWVLALAVAYDTWSKSKRLGANLTASKTGGGSTPTSGSSELTLTSQPSYHSKRRGTMLPSMAHAPSSRSSSDLKTVINTSSSSNHLSMSNKKYILDINLYLLQQQYFLENVTNGNNNNNLINLMTMCDKIMDFLVFQVDIQLKRFLNLVLDKNIPISPMDPNHDDQMSPPADIDEMGLQIQQDNSKYDLNNITNVYNEAIALLTVIITTSIDISLKFSRLDILLKLLLPRFMKLTNTITTTYLSYNNLNMDGSPKISNYTSGDEFHIVSTSDSELDSKTLFIKTLLNRFYMTSEQSFPTSIFTQQLFKLVQAGHKNDLIGLTLPYNKQVLNTQRIMVFDEMLLDVVVQTTIKNTKFYMILCSNNNALSKLLLTLYNQQYKSQLHPFPNGLEMDGIMQQSAHHSPSKQDKANYFNYLLKFNLQLKIYIISLKLLLLNTHPLYLSLLTLHTVTKDKNIIFNIGNAASKPFFSPIHYITLDTNIDPNEQYDDNYSTTRSMHYVLYNQQIPILNAISIALFNSFITTTNVEAQHQQLLAQQYEDEENEFDNGPTDLLSAPSFLNPTNDPSSFTPNRLSRSFSTLQGPPQTPTTTAALVDNSQSSITNQSASTNSQTLTTILALVGPHLAKSVDYPLILNITLQLGLVEEYLHLAYGTFQLPIIIHTLLKHFAYIGAIIPQYDLITMQKQGADATYNTFNYLSWYCTYSSEYMSPYALNIKKLKRITNSSVSTPLLNPTENNNAPQHHPLLLVLMYTMYNSIKGFSYLKNTNINYTLPRLQLHHIRYIQQYHPILFEYFTSVYDGDDTLSVETGDDLTHSSQQRAAANNIVNTLLKYTNINTVTLYRAQIISFLFSDHCIKSTLSKYPNGIITNSSYDPYLADEEEDNEFGLQIANNSVSQCVEIMYPYLHLFLNELNFITHINKQLPPSSPKQGQAAPVVPVTQQINTHKNIFFELLCDLLAFPNWLILASTTVSNTISHNIIQQHGIDGESPSPAVGSCGSTPKILNVSTSFNTTSLVLPPAVSTPSGTSASITMSSSTNTSALANGGKHTPSSIPNSFFSSFVPSSLTNQVQPSSQTKTQLPHIKQPQQTPPKPQQETGLFSGWLSKASNFVSGQNTDAIEHVSEQPQQSGLGKMLNTQQDTNNVSTPTMQANSTSQITSDSPYITIYTPLLPLPIPTIDIIVKGLIHTLFTAKETESTYKTHNNIYHKAYKHALNKIMTHTDGSSCTPHSTVYSDEYHFKEVIHNTIPFTNNIVLLFSLLHYLLLRNLVDLQALITFHPIVLQTFVAYTCLASDEHVLSIYMVNTANGTSCVNEDNNSLTQQYYALSSAFVAGSGGNNKSGNNSSSRDSSNNITQDDIQYFIAHKNQNQSPNENDERLKRINTNILTQRELLLVSLIPHVASPSQSAAPQATSEQNISTLLLLAEYATFSRALLSIYIQQRNFEKVLTSFLAITQPLLTNDQSLGKTGIGLSVTGKASPVTKPTTLAELNHFLDDSDVALLENDDEDENEMVDDDENALVFNSSPRASSPKLSKQQQKNKSLIRHLSHELFTYITSELFSTLSIDSQTNTINNNNSNYDDFFKKMQIVMKHIKQLLVIYPFGVISLYIMLITILSTSSSSGTVSKFQSFFFDTLAPKPIANAQQDKSTLYQFLKHLLFCYDVHTQLNKSSNKDDQQQPAASPTNSALFSSTNFSLSQTINEPASPTADYDALSPAPGSNLPSSQQQTPVSSTISLPPLVGTAFFANTITTSKLSQLIQSCAFQLPSIINEQYIELLCQYEPQRVYPYILTLNKHNSINNNIDLILKLCKDYKIYDAQAYILERTGDIRGALDLLFKIITNEAENIQGIIHQHIGIFQPILIRDVFAPFYTHSMSSIFNMVNDSNVIKQARKQPESQENTENSSVNALNRHRGLGISNQVKVASVSELLSKQQDFINNVELSKIDFNKYLDSTGEDSLDANAAAYYTDEYILEQYDLSLQYLLFNNFKFMNVIHLILIPTKLRKLIAYPIQMAINLCQRVSETQSDQSGKGGDHAQNESNNNPDIKQMDPNNVKLNEFEQLWIDLLLLLIKIERSINMTRKKSYTDHVKKNNNTYDNLVKQTMVYNKSFNHGSINSQTMLLSNNTPATITSNDTIVGNTRLFTLNVSQAALTSTAGQQQNHHHNDIVLLLLHSIIITNISKVLNALLEFIPAPKVLVISMRPYMNDNISHFNLFFTLLFESILYEMSLKQTTHKLLIADQNYLQNSLLATNKRCLNYNSPLKKLIKIQSFARSHNDIVVDKFLPHLSEIPKSARNTKAFKKHQNSFQKLIDCQPLLSIIKYQQCSLCNGDITQESISHHTVLFGCGHFYHDGCCDVISDIIANKKQLEQAHNTNFNIIPQVSLRIIQCPKCVEFGISGVGAQNSNTANSTTNNTTLLSTTSDEYHYHTSMQNKLYEQYEQDRSFSDIGHRSDAMVTSNNMNLMLAKSFISVIDKLHSSTNYQAFRNTSKDFTQHIEAELLKETATPYSHGNAGRGDDNNDD